MKVKPEKKEIIFPKADILSEEGFKQLREMTENIGYNQCHDELTAYYSQKLAEKDKENKI